MLEQTASCRAARIRRLGTGPASLAAVLVSLSSLTATTQRAQAIGISLPFVSVSVEVYKKTIRTPFGPITITIDPDSIQSLDLNLSYDTGMFSFVQAGFVCDFSSNGNCPPAQALTGTNQVSIFGVTLGNPLTGSTALVNVNTTLGTIDLNYDLTNAAGPPLLGTDRNAFGVTLQALVPLTDTVTYQTAPGSYNFGVTSSSCTAVVGGQPTTCGSNTPITGVTFSTTPEPGSLVFSITCLGLGCLWAIRRRLRSRACGNL
jgi:hypothetical protein